mgnify:CR=1 FL=1
MDYKNIAEMFVGTTEKCSSKKLLVYKKNNNWVALNGKDVQITVEDVSFGLRSLNIEQNSNIAILSNNSPKWAMSDYGIICSAMTTVTIYPTLIASQVEFILKNSNSKLVFVENQEQLNKVKECFDSCDELKYIVVMDDSCDNETENIINFISLLDKGKEFSQNYELSFNDMVNSINEDDILTIIYTSGTTGVPKGVVLTHKGQFDEALDLFEKAVQLDPDQSGHRLNVSLIYYLKGDRDRADALYRQIIAEDEAYDGLLDFLAEVESAQEHYRIAAAYITQEQFDRALDRSVGPLRSSIATKMAVSLGRGYARGAICLRTPTKGAR